jgi:WKF domain
MTAALIKHNEHQASDPFPTRRIPAWKKLGLKLKFANEHADQLPQLDSKNYTDKKRPRAETSQRGPAEAIAERKVQKRHRLGSPNAPPSKSPGTDLKALSPSLRRESNGSRKTVSFTSDTKVEDGDSSKSLIADWEAQYDQPSLQANPPKDSKSPKEKLVKAKKSKLSFATKKPHAALEYLTRFRQSKETWKFNKNKEIWILKHLFSVEDIPSEYDLALSQYLQGLKASAARSRIQQEAQETIVKDQEQQIDAITATASKDSTTQAGKLDADMEDPERRRAYYEDSIRRYKRKLEAHLDEVAEDELNWVSPERLAKRRRAEITLWALGVTPSNAEEIQSSSTTISEGSASCNGTSTRENRLQSNTTSKKRKNRTSVVELSSSNEDASSSDFGSSESQSEDDDQSAGETGRTGTTSGTSSSGSSIPSDTPIADSSSGSESGSSDESAAETDNDAGKGAVHKPSRRQPSIISISS